MELIHICPHLLLRFTFVEVNHPFVVYKHVWVGINNA